MKALIIGLSLFISQINTLQEKPVVHLPSHRNAISGAFGGKLLELINSPAEISLPLVVPRLNPQGVAWSLDVKNLGPHPVTITDNKKFILQINVGQTIHIYADGTLYSSLPCRSPCTPRERR